MSLSRVSIGVAGALGPGILGPLAAVVERSGFGALWVNDTDDGDSLAGIAAAAEHTSTLVLATGVVPVDRRPAGEIADAVRGLSLPAGRLVLGIGSGRLRTGALEAVGSATRMLRDVTGARVVVGALGPRMRRLAVEESDGVLFNWLTPEAAGDQASALHDLRPGTHVALYVRTALEPGALAARDEQARLYARIPAYAANFARLGFDAADTVLPRVDEPLRTGVAAYLEAVDEIVLRAITPQPMLDDNVRFVEEAARLLRG